ncbi:MAG: right-handed parallel beta-helix repeat-containing protein, partial [Oscillospiraceae bacterium]|nr:right-handed parallel beta-helix repeat-containing protein [Oscillospiraceae bacterium]
TDFPMAAHPDQVWIDETRQEQVQTLSEVSEGKFFVDYAKDKLYIGSNPTGMEVRASDLGSTLNAPIGGAPKGAAITVVSPNVTIRGIGVRRYATCVPDQGTIYANDASKGLTIENVEIAYNATTGLSIFGADNVTLQSVSSHDNGLSGINAGYCDSLRLNKVSATRNNAESFNVAPTAAGVKIGRSRDVIVSNSEMSDNRANGLWFDEDCYNMNVVSNEFSNNRMTGHEENHTIKDPVTGKTYTCVNAANGLVIEISGIAKVANNRFINNSADGFLVLMSDNIQIWNNTIIGGKYSLEIKNGAGRIRTWQAGLDKYSPGYPALSWVVDNINIANNIIGGASTNLLLIKDDTKTRTDTMGVTLDGNVYHRSSVSSPNAIIKSLTQDFSTLSDFRKETGQDSQSIEFTGKAPLNAFGFATLDLQRKADTIAQVIPADIAAVSNLHVGEKILGPVLTRIGNLETLTIDKAVGWASDPSNPDASVIVKFYIFDKNDNQVSAESVVANLPRSDVGNHGFSTKIDWSKFQSGKYKVIPYGVFGATEYQLAGTKYYTVD